MEARSLAERIFGKKDARLLDTLSSAAAAYHSLDDPEGSALEERVRRLRERRRGEDEPGVTALLAALGNDAYSPEPGDEKLLERALSHAQRLGRSSHQYAAIVGSMGALRLDQGRIPEGESLIRSAVEALDQVYGRELDPAMPDVALRLATLFSSHQYYAEAVRALRHSLRLKEKRWGSKSPAVAQVLHRLGQMELCDFAPDRAEKYLRKALEMAADKDFEMEVVASLGGCLHAAGKLSEAEVFYRRYLAHVEQEQGPESPRVAQSLHYLMVVLYGRGETEQGRAVLERILRLESKASKELRLEIAQRLRVFGHCLNEERFLRESLRIRESVLGKKHGLVAQSMADLAELLGDTREARSFRKRSERLTKRLRDEQRRQMTASDRALALQLGYWASMRRREGRPGDAQTLVRRAEALLSEDSGRLRSRLTGLVTV